MVLLFIAYMVNPFIAYTAPPTSNWVVQLFSSNSFICRVAVALLTFAIRWYFAALKYPSKSPGPVSNNRLSTYMSYEFQT